MVVGALMILSGIVTFFELSIRTIIVGIYLVVFGLAVGGLELLPQVPPYLPKYASFLFSFLGRGIFYIFMGTLCFEQFTILYISGSIIVFSGIVYAALEFVPSIEPPSNMRDADAGWGAEQV
ncbi:uncharacterized protein HMPREF1541_04070 [Cyphellophora europaea CBS 101466]|uniref:Golgi apparatus membrane protein tvp15 n=1 Tax=Cyphellophora europaea (strain CBS 101466) TaxID=1220924 RepID=W2S2E0_CYPE1|nr:uncharacterized protein HMPREF1541_04070 [Cyphellophora europaea CBS 101466]ETN42129.1 hypothetical protein HMPREF1541_04070 [Cyphellophora europaea CBS 101466]